MPPTKIATPTIRPFRRGDAKALIGLIRSLARFEKLKPPTAAAGKRLVGDIGRRIRVLMVELDGEAIGYAIYFFSYSTFIGRPTLYLEDMFIHPEQRRGGIGRKLFKALRREARREKCGRMDWMVLGWNRRAVRFYESLGGRSVRDWVLYRLEAP